VVECARAGVATTWAVSTRANWEAAKDHPLRKAGWIHVVSWSGVGDCTHDGWHTPSDAVTRALASSPAVDWGDDAPDRWVAEQERIIGLDADEPAIVVAAGAGTGKTQTMLLRVRRILFDDPSVHPRDIALVTFTRAAAASMRLRLGTMLGNACRALEESARTGGDETEARLQRMRALADGLGECSIRTIDAWCLDFLRIHGGGQLPRLGDSSELKERALDYALAEVVGKLAARAGNRGAAHADDVYQLHKSVYSPWKWTHLRMKCKEAWEAADRSGLREEEWATIQWTRLAGARQHGSGEAQLDQVLGPVVARAQHRYREMLEERHQAELSDLLRGVLGRLASPASLQLPRFMFMDELQDSSPAQIELLTALRKRGVRTLAVGDWKQAIYGFRGATPDAMTAVPGLLGAATTYPLSTNFRSTPALLAGLHTIFAGIRETGATATATSAPPPSDPFPYDEARDRLSSPDPAAVASRPVLVREDTVEPAAFLVRARASFAGARTYAYLVRSNAEVDEIDEKFRRQGPVGLSVRVIRSDDEDHRRFARAILTLARFASFASPSDGVPRSVEAQLPLLLHLADGPFKDQLWPEGAPSAEDLCAKPTEGLERVQVQARVSWLMDRCLGAPEPYRRELLRWLGRAVDGVGIALATPAAIADWLDVADTGEDPAAVVAAASGAQGPTVFVMTVHQAKGLEFDVVMVPGWSFADFRGCRVVPARQTEHGPHTGPKAGEPVACWSWHWKSARKPTWTNHDRPSSTLLRGEDLRLFYVALTRARRGIVYGNVGLCAQYIQRGARG
jgi:superfamily I DNA/RNA helicase